MTSISRLPTLPTCRVVIRLSGDGVSSDQAQELASLFGDVSGDLGVDVVEVTVRDNGEVETGELADIVVIGISVGASVLGLLLVVLLSATVVCVVRRCTYRRQQTKYR